MKGFCYDLVMQDKSLSVLVRWFLGHACTDPESGVEQAVRTPLPPEKSQRLRVS